MNSVSGVPGLQNGAEPKPASAAARSEPDAATALAMRQKAEASQRLTAAFGGIVTVMMNTPAFQSRTLAEMRHAVLPALQTGQFSLAQAHLKEAGEVRPIGVVLWASVSDEVDGRLAADSTAQVRLEPHEWQSGPHLWIVESIGERTVIANQIRRLREREWRGRAAKIKVRGQDGAPVVRVLPAA